MSPCGAGYGDPLQRDPQMVLDDVRDELISLESAINRYGLAPDKAVESLTGALV